MVGDTAFYTWSTPQMVNDVQAWLDNSSSNFGWIILGDENKASTAKRFNSRENSNAERRPFLTINYMVSTGINDLTENIPEELTLFQNYPNPFNPTTSISFSIPSTEFVTLRVYNLLGQIVAILVNKEMQAGNHEVSFDARNLVSGPYYYQLEVGDKIQVKKMVLLK